MNTMQKLFYSGVASLTVIHSTSAQGTAGGINFGQTKVDGRLKGDDRTLDVTAQTIVGNIMLFLAVIAVLYGIYGGFLIMTAGGDDGKVKTGKTILIQVAIGLVVIFLANSLVKFIIEAVLKGNT